MSNGSLTLATTWRSETAESHHQDVERVITEMHRNLAENLALEQLADIAIMSPFHFNRVFRCVTGIPPCRFLWMLRLEEAKALLLNTNRKVIDVCYDVGYNSLGTFTRRFTELVGIPPLRFRRLATDRMVDRMEAVNSHLTKAADPESSRSDNSRITAFVTHPDVINVSFIGLFNSPVPYQAPVSCTTATSTGFVQLSTPGDGDYFLYAAGLQHSGDPIDYMLSDRIFRSSADVSAIEVRTGTCEQVHRITLRPPQLTDPPLLPCLPALIQKSIGDSKLLQPAM